MNTIIIQRYISIWTVFSLLMAGATIPYAQQPVAEAQVTFEVA